MPDEIRPANDAATPSDAAASEAGLSAGCSRLITAEQVKAVIQATPGFGAADRTLTKTAEAAG